jgi:hypothetical protein
LKTIKTLIKEPTKTIKDQNKMDQIGIIIIIEKKTLKNKIESHKNFDKKAKNKNKKLKVKGPNQKILSIQIKKQGLN